MRLLIAAFLIVLAPMHGQQAFDANSITAFQQELNAEYSDSLKSPLLAADFATFTGLDFYDANPDFAVTAKLIKAKKQKPFAMKTSTDRLPMYVKYGELHFTLDGKSFVLNVYRNINLSKRPGFEDYLFLPFSDKTNGVETYIGGRYIDIRVPKGDTMIIDFNKAYNPYCAYNYKFSCPIVPLENDLDIEIKAGVKKFHD